MDHPAAAHFIDTYLKRTQNWVGTQLQYLIRYRPLVLTYSAPNPPTPSPPYHAVFSQPALLRKLDAAGHHLLGFHPSMYWQLWRRNVQILHAHFGNRAYHVLPLVNACDRPFVVTFYGYDLTQLPHSEPIWKGRYQDLFAAGDLFLVEGSHMRSELLNLGCPPRKARVHHLGVDTDQYEPRPRTFASEGPLRILMVGRFTEKKGLSYGLKGFTQFLSQGGSGHLTIVGDAAEEIEEQKNVKERLLSIVDQHNLEKHVDFRGFLSPNAMTREYYNHHVLLAPSVVASSGDKEGGAPVSLIEAQATGMPVVGSDHCDIPEVVRNNETGVIIPERDAEAVAEALFELFESPASIEIFGREARNHIEQRYAASRQGERLAQLYDEICP